MIRAHEQRCMRLIDNGPGAQEPAAIDRRCGADHAAHQRVVDTGSRVKDTYLTANRSGPRLLDSGLSEISTAFHAAAFATTLKYTASGVRRSSAA